jgi:hypothetical protein
LYKCWCKLTNQETKQVMVGTISFTIRY